MEAIILCGGKAERLGDAAGGRPKSLVEVAGRPLAAYQVARLGKAGVERVIMRVRGRAGRAVRAGARGARARGRRRRGAGAASAAAAGSSSRPAAGARSGDVYALNGDELVAVDFAALLARHREAGRAATVAVAQPQSPFGVVELGERRRRSPASARAARSPTGSAAASTSSRAEALERFPDRGDHETTTFPELAPRGGSSPTGTRGSG